ncbi:YitT family protein [Christensenella tenuis]|jgi:uncharacterized membrane-anchored protein YitT (DUF2179 family)|uniref:YitT family protein n=1 Tax=Christensenella tenuis TaxID=2763033 RepID=A0ABR7EE93_9FIRM|nr:YitT family protein [Christensenella tenuis]MBC5647334.1 YitT family protein [Christensenella tenuis]
MEKKVYVKGKVLVTDLLLFLAGSLIFAIAINTFISPNNIAPGGLTGVATMLNYTFGLPIGTMVIVMNIPLFIIAFFSFGFEFIIKTVVAAVISSAMIDLTEGILPVYHGDPLITIVFGGAFYGAGLALILMRGGTDLVANLINKRFPHMPMAKMILFTNVVVVVCSGFVYENLESPLYAVIVIFIELKVIDVILYGTSVATGKMLFIISKENDRIANEILCRLRRGVTALKSRGVYTDWEGEMLMCAVHRPEITKLYHLIYKIDPDAFIIVGDAGQIRGAGFMPNADPTGKNICMPFKKEKNDAQKMACCFAVSV